MSSIMSAQIKRMHVHARARIQTSKYTYKKVIASRLRVQFPFRLRQKMIFYARVLQNADQGWLDPQLLDSAEDVNALIGSESSFRSGTTGDVSLEPTSTLSCYIEIPNAGFVYNLSQPSSNRTEALTICGNLVLRAACDGGETDAEGNFKMCTVNFVVT